MKLSYLLSILDSVKEEDCQSMLQSGMCGSRDITENITELINDLSGFREEIISPNVAKMRALMDKKVRLAGEAEVLEEKVKCYEEDEKKRLVFQQKLADMQEAIEQRSKDEKRFESFSGTQFIEETGALIRRRGEETARLKELSDRLDSDRAKYHEHKARQFSLLGEIETLRGKIDILQHSDMERGDITTLIDHLIGKLQRLVKAFSAGKAKEEEADRIMDEIKGLKPLVSMLEAKLRDYGLVLPEKFMQDIREIL